MHLQRRELGVNGLASYIDVHSHEDSGLHGVKLSVDANLHVRTNSLIKVQVSDRATSEVAVPSIPLPGLKIKELNTRHRWKSWVKMELETQGNYLKFVLENEGVSEDQNYQTHEYLSPLKTVKCVVSHRKDVVDSELLMQNTAGWIKSFLKYLELASDLFVDLIPEILQYIDENTFNPISSTDEEIIGILMDRAALLIPYKEGLMSVGKYGGAINIANIEPSALARVASTLGQLETIRMADIQSILEEEMIVGAELEEEVIVFSLAYLIHLDMFDHKHSFLLE